MPSHTPPGISRRLGALLIATTLSILGCGGDGSKPKAPSITSFSASPMVLTSGESCELKAVFADGDGTIEPGVGTVSSGRPALAAPRTDTTYNLTVSNGASQATASVAVKVVPAPSARIQISTRTAVEGASDLQASVPDQPGCTYQWSVDNGAILSGATTRMAQIQAGRAGAMNLTAKVTNAAGRSESETIQVMVLSTPAIQSFTAAQNPAPAGLPVMLTAVFSGGTGTLNTGQTIASGTPFTVVPMADTVYTLTVTGPMGQTATENLVLRTYSRPKVEITSFTATPPKVVPGAAVELRAVYVGTKGVVEGVGELVTGKSLTVYPTKKTTYRLVVQDDAGNSATAQVEVDVLTPAQALKYLEEKGALPKLDRSSSLAGPDENKNGVRDDIDAHITARLTKPEQRTAATELAKMLQESLLIDKLDAIKLKDLSTRMMQALSQLHGIFTATSSTITPGVFARELEACSTNTKSRLLAYLAFSKALDGTTGTVPLYLSSSPGAPQAAQGSLQAPSALAAPDTDLCNKRGVAFVFFNGVKTTFLEAAMATHYLSETYGRMTPGGDYVVYDFCYNYTNGLEDFVEVFEQRMREQSPESVLLNRWELFFDFMSGNGTWTDRIIELWPQLGQFWLANMEYILTRTINNYASLLSNPPTFTNYAEHRARLDNHMLEGRKLLLYAHSQGNLFVNSAYSYAENKIGSSSVKVVHVAPASPTTSGPHALADKDLVINGLRSVGNVPSITDTIPAWPSGRPGLNGKKDPLGHGLLEIYLNPSFTTSTRLKGYVNEAFNTLVAPTATVSTGFFTVTMDWDGSGDVDLHVNEPNGTHVYYRNTRGLSGYLDVDNTVGYGPEHYFATCDSRSLQEGDYRIGVANYARATGRRVTIQVATWNDGVLGTKSFVLGGVTGDTPAYYPFTVRVRKDPASGRYIVRIL